MFPSQSGVREIRIWPRGTSHINKILGSGSELINERLAILYYETPAARALSLDRVPLPGSSWLSEIISTSVKPVLKLLLNLFPNHAHILAVFIFTAIQKKRQPDVTLGKVQNSFEQFSSTLALLFPAKPCCSPWPCQSTALVAHSHLGMGCTPSHKAGSPKPKIKRRTE